MTYGRHDAAAVDIFGQMFVIGGIGPGRSYITYLHEIYSQQKYLMNFKRLDGELLNNLEIYEPNTRRSAITTFFNPIQ